MVVTIYQIWYNQFRARAEDGKADPRTPVYPIPSNTGVAIREGWDRLQPV